VRVKKKKKKKKHNPRLSKPRKGEPHRRLFLSSECSNQSGERASGGKELRDLMGVKRDAGTLGDGIEEDRHRKKEEPYQAWSRV